MSQSNQPIDKAGVVIVAGAGSGIGRATASRLAESGWHVGCLDRNLEAVEELADSLVARDLRAIGLGLDVGQVDSVSAAIDEAQLALGPARALVNCVGITGRTNVLSHEVAIDDFDLVTSTNLRGAFLLSRSVLPGMIERGYGRILHVASIAGKEGNAGMVAYSATKAGLIGMVKSQGKEYAQAGVTINAVAPAVIQTPMVDVMPPEQVRYMTEKIPMGRLGTLAEISSLIEFIISPATGFVTGFTWDMTGGRATY